MLHDIIVFAPFFVCLFWMIIHSIESFRTLTLPSLLIMTGVAALFFMIDGYYSSINGTPDVYIWFSLFFQLVAPSLIPAALLYMRTLKNNEKVHPGLLVWVVVPTGLFVISGMLMSIIGKEPIESFVQVINTEGISALPRYKGELVFSYFIWSHIILRVILGLEMLYMFLYLLVAFIKKGYSAFALYGFFFKGTRLEVLHLQMFPVSIIGFIYFFKIFLFRDYLVLHPSITVILSLLSAFACFLCGYLAQFGAKGAITLKDAATLLRFNFSSENRDSALEEMAVDTLNMASPEVARRILRTRLGAEADLVAWENGESVESSLASSIFSSAPENTDETSLMSRFQRLMLDEQYYLRPGLSLNDVAERLGSNKTYVSKMVNNTYNLGFPELLNALRVDYAKHYLLLHKDAKQEHIARDCGFFSASSFNTIFKKVTGTTPRVWVASQEKKYKLEQ